MFSRSAPESDGESGRDIGRDSAREEYPAQDATPDAMFPHLPHYLADTLREEAIRELQHLGYHTSWRPDGQIAATKDNSNWLIDLDNLSLQISQLTPPPSREDIASHIQHHVDSITNGIDPNTTAEVDFLRQLKVRLSPRELLESSSLEHGGSAAAFDLTTRPWTEELTVSLVMDSPKSVITLSDKTLHSRGIDTPTDLEDLWRIGYRNLWQELIDAEISVKEIHGNDPGANFYAVESGSFFLASAVLFFEDFLPHWAPDLSLSDGVMLALPNRHLLLFRAVTGGKDLLEGINSMASTTVGHFADFPGPLSPQLHLMREGSEVLPFTKIGENDSGDRIVEIFPDDFLMDRLNEGREPTDPEEHH